MSDQEWTPVDVTSETPDADGTDGLPAGPASPIPIERLERMAERVGGVIRRTIPSAEKTQVELHTVVAELARLQAQVTEWGQLHHLLHEALSTFSTFQAQLGLLAADDPEAGERQALLKSWVLCQDALDALAGFAEDVKIIGCPLRRDGRELRGERWVVELVALQFLFEDALKEERLSPQALLDLAEEYRVTCTYHLSLVNRELQAAVRRFGRLAPRLLGGIE